MDCFAGRGYASFGEKTGKSLWFFPIREQARPQGGDPVFLEQVKIPSSLGHVLLLRMVEH